MNPIISVQNLRKHFKNITAVDGLNLSVNKGDVYGFLGPNGAGKSTTIRMLVNLISPTSGEIKIFEKGFAHHRNYILSRIGCIVEKPDFYSYLSAEKNLDLFSRLSGLTKSKKEIHSLLDNVGLSGRYLDKVKTFSHGMKQRLGLAQALLNNPELVILDEPTTGLDPQGIIDIRNMILHLSENQNKTILLSSHILSEIELISNRMVIINKGKAVAEGAVKDLLSTQILFVTFDINDVQKAKSILSETGFGSKIKRSNGHELVLQLDKQEIPVVNKIIVDAGIAVNEINHKRPLEEFFLQLTATPPSPINLN